MFLEPDTVVTVCNTPGAGVHNRLPNSDHRFPVFVSYPDIQGPHGENQSVRHSTDFLFFKFEKA